MFLSTKASWRYRQRWTTLVCILCLHLAAFWMFVSSNSQRKIEAARYLTIFNVPPVEKLPDQANKSLNLPRDDIRKTVMTNANSPKALTNVPPAEVAPTLPTATSPDTTPRLNLDMLRGQAVEIERSRTKSAIEKMNDNKRLDLTLETTFAKEVNRVELPECRQLLLGKLMPERMMIIQDHSKKKFCRSSM